MSKATVKIFILITAFLICFISLEVLLRFYFSIRTNYDIEMWKYSVQLKQSVEDLRSHIHIPNTSARLMNVDVQINSKGLRDREFPYEKPVNTYRILALGDSVTLGWGIPLEKSLAKQIENGLSTLKENHKTEVLNFGIGNYNTIQELESYIQEGRKYHADAALLFVHITDAEPTQKHTLNWFTRKSYVYAFLQQRIAQLRPWIDPGNHYIEYYQSFFHEKKWEEYKKILAQTTETFKNDQLKVIIVLLPELRSLQQYPFYEYHQKLSEFFQEENIPVIDLLPVFLGKTQSEILVAADDPHPSQLGHDLISREVLKQIQEKGLLP